MRIFLTGGTGFLGSHFVNEAMERGHEVVALRRHGSHPRVALRRTPVWAYGNLDDDLTEALSGCDVVVHLAAHTANPPYDTLEACLYWNLTAPLKLFEQARKSGVKRFLVAGSCFEYGRAGERYERIPVNAPLEPTGTYPTSKAAASIAFSGFAAEYEISIAIYRIFQVFGEGEPESRLWPSLRRAALDGDDFRMTAGEQVRDFIAVEAVAARFVDGLVFEDWTPGKAKIRNVGTGTPQTVRAFAESWWQAWKATGSLRFGEVPYRRNEVMRYVPEVD